MRVRERLVGTCLIVTAFIRKSVQAMVIIFFMHGHLEFASADSPAVEQDPTRTTIVQRSLPLSTEQSLDAFEIAEGFEIELVACEPLVIDPITIRFDDRGRMWVVEMIDYPDGPPGGAPYRGRIKILEDLNEDGYFETSHLFADKLVFPTGLQPFQQGVIVTLAGEIAYLADTDDDCVCDQRETWFTGFSKENEQLRANHPTWTLENQIHVASGLRGGEIHANDARWPAVESPLSLATRDFQFSPFGGTWQAVAGNSQYGFYQDELGRNYVCSNRNPCDLLLADVSQALGNPLLPLTNWTVPLMPIAENSRVYPLVDAWTTSNLHAGTFTAACGVHRYESDMLKDSLGQDFFACEPTGSLVQRYRTIDEGIVPATERAHDKREFLASHDPWFRPVDLTDGPDGALYVVDMHRAVIEHPDWMPSELQDRKDMRWGDNAGRIYRVVPAGRSSRNSTSVHRFRFEPQAPWLWVESLVSPNRWTRTTGSRKIAEYLSQKIDSGEVSPKSIEERRNASDLIIQKLRELLYSSDTTRSLGVSRALWLLESSGRLIPEDVVVASRHSKPEVRRQATRLWSRHPDFQVNREAVCQSLASDNDPAVRFQWLMEFASKAKVSDIPHLVNASDLTAACSHEEIQWLSRAMSLVSVDIAPEFIRDLLKAMPGNSGLIAPLVKRMGWIGDHESLEVLLQASPLASDSDTISGSTLLDEFAEGMIVSQRQWRDLHVKLKNVTSHRLQAYEAKTLAMARDTTLTKSDRVAALRRAGLSDSSELEPLCRSIALTESSDLFIEALVIARRWDFSDWDQLLVSRVVELPPQSSTASVQALVGHRAWTSALVGAIESSAIPWGMIDPVAMSQLERHPDPEIVQRMKTLKASRRNEGREEMFVRYRSALNAEPNASEGRSVFVKNCANCHRIGVEGVAVGPDISDLRTQTAEQILLAILDPNLATDANYFRYSVLTLDGQVVEGLLEDSNEQAVTLKSQNGDRRVIARDQVDVLKATGQSIMPEGFENQISPKSMRDLIGYLKRWRTIAGQVP